MGCLTLTLPVIGRRCARRQQPPHSLEQLRELQGEVVHCGASGSSQLLLQGSAQHKQRQRASVHQPQHTDHRGLRWRCCCLPCPSLHSQSAQGKGQVQGWQGAASLCTGVGASVSAGVSALPLPLQQQGWQRGGVCQGWEARSAQQGSELAGAGAGARLQ